jgi:hypothetical protein
MVRPETRVQTNYIPLSKETQAILDASLLRTYSGQLESLKEQFKDAKTAKDRATLRYTIQRLISLREY